VLRSEISRSETILANCGLELKGRSEEAREPHKAIRITRQRKLRAHELSLNWNGRRTFF